jgi:hypothetical protein
MSNLGDVVFCLDHDIARTARVDGCDAGSARALDGPQRRMATKKDANGDPLCVACLDARQARRRAEFMLHEGRAPLAGHNPANVGREADQTPTTSIKSGFIRIARSRTTVTAANARPRKKRERHTNAVRPSGGRVERQFLMLVVEIGLLRAHQLLQDLRARSRKVAALPKRAERGQVTITSF